MYMARGKFAVVRYRISRWGSENNFNTKYMQNSEKYLTG